MPELVIVLALIIAAALGSIVIYRLRIRRLGAPVLLSGPPPINMIGPANPEQVALEAETMRKQLRRAVRAVRAAVDRAPQEGLDAGPLPEFVADIEVQSKILDELLEAYIDQCRSYQIVDVVGRNATVALSDFYVELMQSCSKLHVALLIARRLDVPAKGIESIELRSTIDRPLIYPLQPDYKLLAASSGSPTQYPKAAESALKGSVLAHIEAARDVNSQVLPVMAYLENESGNLRLETALVDVFEAFDLDDPEWGQSVRGSWFRALFARSRKFAQSDVAKEIYGETRRALELRALHEVQANVDEKKCTSVKGLIEALADQQNAVIMIGSILLLKDAGMLCVRDLTQQELIHLERNPMLLRDPHALFRALQELPSNETS
ncbi:hypothetical protein ACTWPT_59420 [Nonomuraea sp. 3N208]|uniref:hypothetical protein n=1 Tax=Nonomuraea sp. 3N208 TaxID=3457421 RepID=UPI003FD233B1